MTYYKIAGLILSIDGEDRLIHDNLSKFTISDNRPVTSCDISVRLIKTSGYELPYEKALVFSPYMEVYKSEFGFNIKYHQSPDIIGIELDDNTNSAVIYVNSAETGISYPDIKEQIFLAIRDIFFSFCPKFGMIPIHSSSVLYNGKVYLFSAPSGTGKTTHANLWLEHTDAAVFNGDVCMLEPCDSHVTAHGIPWCGSTTDYMNASYELGEIFFLKRSGHDSVASLNQFTGVINLTSRSFASNWTKAQMATILDIAGKIASVSKTASLECTPTINSLNTVLKHIKE